MSGLHHLDPAVVGGRRSLKILDALNEARITAIGSARASRAVSELAWQPAQAYGIERDDVRAVWHAGHVEAVLSNGHSVIAGTQTGGVWLLTPSQQPSFIAGHTGVALSDLWDQPNVSSLAFGPDGDSQVFAGLAGGSALFLLEFELVMGAMVFKRSVALPLPVSGPTFAIVTLPEPRSIVIAGTSGLWWSPVPETAADVSGYHWKPGLNLPVAWYGGLAVGSGPSVTGAVWPQAPDATTPPDASGFHRGTFQGSELVFAKSVIAGTDADRMRRTTLASCADARERMYAVAAAPDGTLLAVLSSADGGASWSTRTAPDRGKAGLVGDYNNCITVSPQRADLVVVGWLSGGVFWSDDGGESWSQPHNQETHPALHNDLHSVQLTRNPSGTETLFVAGDGGIVVTRDMGQDYDSQFNRPLRNLQFYDNAITASSRYPGLLAGGTQDHGNLYRRPDTLRPGVPRQADSAWRRQVGGDGGICRFIDPLGVLLNSDNSNTALGMAVWDEVGRRFPEDRPGQVVPADDNPGGAAPTALETIVAPSLERNGQVMYAALASTASGAIHGFFADRPAAGAAPGAGNARLVRVGTFGETVTAISSIGGQTLLLGTPSGRIASFDSATGATVEHEVPAENRGSVTRLQSVGTGAFALAGKRILRFDGATWVGTAGDGWVAFASDPESGRLFATTDADVFISHDQGRTWIDASQGLPVRPHGKDLRIADDGQGGRDLYLATYGRSVWRTTIALTPEEPDAELPGLLGEILFAVIQDGGGLFRLGKRLVKVPPRPIIRDVLAALAAEDMARSMTPESETSARAIRRTALEQIVQIAMRELDQLR